MTRTICLSAGPVDLPVELQAIQEADASWNGQTIMMTWNVVIDQRLEILRAPITVAQAELFARRLDAALKKAIAS